MVESIGGIDANIDYSQPPEIISGLVEENGPEFLTSDRDVCEKWRQLIDATAEKGGSVGGTAAVIFWNLPAGLGSHTQADQRLDGIFAARLMSIPAVKGFEIGHAYELSRMSGSCVDSLFFDNRNGFVRRTNFAGGLEGGMTNGAPLLIRFHLKPIPGGTSSDSINLQTGEKARPASYRSDVQVMQAAAVVSESVLAIELASQILEATGGFNLDLIMQRFEQLKPAF
jgi:chorismate synthase